jgi:hypothetical protein
MLTRRGLLARFGIGAAAVAAGVPALPSLPKAPSKLAEVIASNNALLDRLVDAGVYQRYSGYEPLYVSPDDVITASEYQVS